MLKLSASLTLWVLLPVPVVAVSVWYFGQVIHRLYEKIQASLATLSAKVQENLSGVRVIRAYAQEEAELRGFDEPNREYVAKNVQLIRTWSMFMPSLMSLIGTTFLIVLWQGGYRILHGQMSIGALITFFTYLNFLVWPMIALGWVTNIFQRGAASMGRLNYILNAKPQIDDRDARMPKTAQINGAIEFRNLTFKYPTTIAGAGANGSNGHAGETRPVLKNINLRDSSRLDPGNHRADRQREDDVGGVDCAAVGSAPGTILIDGHPIREWPLETLRRAIGYVPQDTYLFSETVGENIAFGLENFEPQVVRGAAEIANVDGEIQEFRETVRNDGRRARHHAFRRTEAAHGDCARDCPRSADSDPGRFPFRRGYADRRKNPEPVARRDARPDDDSDRAPHVHGARSRPDRRAEGRRTDRARHAR